MHKGAGGAQVPRRRQYEWLNALRIQRNYVCPLSAELDSGRVTCNTDRAPLIYSAVESARSLASSRDGGRVCVIEVVHDHPQAASL
jgi:hypothetical protein